MLCYLMAGDQCTLHHISAHHPLSALMCMGEVATFHQGAAMLAGWKNAVVCQAVKPLLDFYHVCSLFFCCFPLQSSFSKGSWHLQLPLQERLQLLTTHSRTQWGACV